MAMACASRTNFFVLSTFSAEGLRMPQKPTRQMHALFGNISLTRLTVDYLNFFESISYSTIKFIK